MMILNEISSNNPQNYSVKCIIDDEDNKIGRMINSVPVVGNTDTIIEMVEKYQIEEIILSIPSIDKKNKKRILDICAKTGCKLKILPEIYSLISNETNNDLVGQLRDVQLEDLLGREEIRLECSWINKYIKNKTVLVTGGGGSIGSEICRQIAINNPKHLIILDIYENNAYQIQQELIRTYGDSLEMEVEIASIRDKEKMEKLFSSRNIDIVFHAAAHKHVPLMEKNPEESIKNNIMGTLNLVELSNRYNVEKFIQISTDKAVNPTNIMGATKRVCEMIIQSFDKTSNTDYVAVRFGNVLGSNGSVIPLFMDQIKAGGPVTVTHEEITRYFMTIPEAVQLVLRAATIAKGGEIFVLDMGEPVKIKDLAYNLIRLSGLEPDVDIEIKYTGLRPGEKLYEELLITYENTKKTSTVINKVFIEEPIPVDEAMLFDTIKCLESAAVELDREKIFELMEKLVPTYKRTTNCVEVDVYRLTKENVLECVESIIDKGHRNVLLYGAGEVAETIIEVVRDKKDSGLNIVAHRQMIIKLRLGQKTVRMQNCFKRLN
jgi:FlaA1/EpsC-like NDP-sugar epimerase